ncbi:hypothetical protein ACFL2K_00965 [Candidatus Margulisiibacteriota bacterium]
MRYKKNSPEFRSVGIEKFSEITDQVNIYIKFYSKLVEDDIYVFKNGSEIDKFPIPEAIIYLEDEFRYLSEIAKKTSSEKAKEQIKKLHNLKKLFKGKILPEESKYYSDPDPSFSKYGDSEYWARLYLFAYSNKDERFIEGISEIRKRGFYFKINPDHTIQLKYPPNISKQGKEFFLGKYLLPYKNLLQKGINSIQGADNGKK